MKEVPKDLVNKCNSIVGRIVELEINDEDSCLIGTEFLIEAADVKKGIEEKRQFLVRPLQKHINDINAMFKGYAGQLGKADKTVRGKIVSYRTKDLGSIPEKTTTTTKGRTTLTKTWTFEVEDAGLTPFEYLCIDEAKVKKAIAAGVRKIPGIKIFQKNGISVYTK